MESNGAVFPEEELETHTIAEWKEEKQGLVATTRHSLVSVSVFVCYCSSLLVQNQDHNSHLGLQLWFSHTGNLLAQLGYKVAAVLCFFLSDMHVCCHVQTDNVIIATRLQLSFFQEHFQIMLASILQLIKSAGSMGSSFLKHESGLQVLC